MLKIDNNKDRGRVGLSLAIAYFCTNGYCVSVPLNDTQYYDLVVEKDGRFFTVQCKMTETKNNTIDLRSTGGTKGTIYDRVTNHQNLDFLFCVSKNKKMFLIPVPDLILADKHHSIRLQEQPMSKYANNAKCFDTHKYLVDF